MTHGQPRKGQHGPGGPHTAQGELSFGPDIPHLHAEGHGHPQRTQEQGESLEQRVLQGIQPPEAAREQQAEGPERRFALNEKRQRTSRQGDQHGRRNDKEGNPTRRRPAFDDAQSVHEAILFGSRAGMLRKAPALPKERTGARQTVFAYSVVPITPSTNQSMLKRS